MCMKYFAKRILLVIIFLSFFNLTQPTFAVDLSLCPVDQGSGTNYSIATPISCTASNVITDYIAPSKCLKDDSCAQNPTQSSVFVRDGSYPGVVWNHVEGVKIGNEVYPMLVTGNGLASSNRHVLYHVDGDTIGMVEDTTFANREICTGTTIPAFQRVFHEGGQPGGPVGKQSMTCGVPISYSGGNQGYQYTNETPLNPNAKTCSSAHAPGSFTNTFQLIFQGEATCNGQRKNVIAIQNIDGAGKFEVYIYCKDQGLCALYEGIDFTVPSHQPAMWKVDTDVCGGFGFEPKACKVAYDIADKPIQQPQSWSCDGKDILCTITHSFPSLLDYLKADPNYKVPNLNFPGLWTKEAAPALTPLSIQRETRDNDPKKFPQTISTASTRCLYDTEGKLQKQETSSDIIKTNTVEGISWLDQYSNFYATIMALGKRDNQDYRQPSIEIDPLQNGGCAAQIPASVVKTQTEGATGENTFDLIVIVSKVIQSVIASLVNGTASSTTVLVPWKKANYFGNIECQSGGCDANTIIDGRPYGKTIATATGSSLLASNVLGETTDNSMQAGFIQARMPAAIPLTAPKPHGAVDNTFNGGDITNETHTYVGANVMTSYCQLCNSLLPTSLQTECVPICGTPTPTPSTTPTSDQTSCKVADSNNAHTEAVNGSSTITDGVILLALEVSKRTCIPAEILVGVLAKETSGMNYHGPGNETTDTGDPNELICRTTACLSGSGDQGPYSYSQGLFESYITHSQIAPLYNQCIDGLSVNLNSGTKTLSGSPTSKSMGQSMCVFAADFWRYMGVWNVKPACTGSNKRPYSLSEIDPAIVDRYLGVHCAPGWDDPTSPNYKYHDFCAAAIVSFDNAIQLFSDDVANVRNVCKNQ